MMTVFNFGCFSRLTTAIASCQQDKPTVSLQFPFRLTSRRFPPDTSQPGLLSTWQARRPVVVLKFDETGFSQATAPGFKVVIGAIAAAVPAFDIGAVRVGAEEDAAGF